ncbi:secretion/conjugation apparatus DotM-related subunit [Coxiella-like endosymbiont of Rhipicephalus sanguineus]|uniref:secretion/conjugation apparatus DotM-related subunit n=1 Tax=Coxiella-like endosymbiont of Rhipicephalus sanguineus TaxID=1955402 RepID=UPI003FD86A91
MRPLWKGVDVLPIYIKALLVVFFARGHCNHKVADDLLIQIAKSSLHGKLDFSGVEKLLLKYKESKFIKWLKMLRRYINGDFITYCKSGTRSVNDG